MTEELAGGTDLPVQVIGLSRSAYQASNNSGSLAAMTGGRTMPWLRCVNPEASNDPSTTWRIPVPPTGDRAINNRELVILDQRNRFLGSFDLTAGPINDEQPGGAARRAIVRDFIKAAATIVDSDNDGLPDYWERDAFTDLSPEADMTMPERGGRSVFAEYALGPWPPELTLEVPVGGGAPVRTLRYRRRLGIADDLIYGVATAAGLTAWEPVVASEISVEAARPVYDGSGMGEVVVRWLLPGVPEGQLFRVTATAPFSGLPNHEQIFHHRD